MTDVNNTGNGSLLLPQMKGDRDIRSDGIGAWALHPDNAFQSVATSLEYRAPGELNSVSSVPTIWAHPLTIEMALHNPNHPIKDQVVEQWRGMLAAIAFTEAHSYPLKVKRIKVGELAHNPFDRALKQLVPDAVNALYDRYEVGENHPWRDIFVFLWNDQPVGMSSPSTIVVPSAAGNWGSLRWYDATAKRLRSPHKVLSEEDKAQLYLWLDGIARAVNVESLGGNPFAVNNIVRLIGEFQRDLCSQRPDVPLYYSDTRNIFGLPINRGLLAVLDKPIKAAAKDSNVTLVPSADKTPKKPLILLDPDVAGYWGRQPEDIYVYKENTLAKVNPNDIETYRMTWQDVNCVTPADLFLTELKFVDNTAEAIPGGLMPEMAQPIIFAGEYVTPLIPVNSILLEYLTPEDLVSRMSFRQIDGGEPQLQVSLDLPLTGMNNGSPPETYRLVKTYPLKQENALATVPVLELWPNFRSPDWKAYYALFFDLAAGNLTFRVSFPGNPETETFTDEQEGSYSLTRLEEFPSAIECLDESNQLIGIILPAQPPRITPKAKWNVGVDFGTSFTNIYTSTASKVEPLTFDDDLLFKVTESPLDSRFPTLFNYFIPDRFLPAEKPLPLSSVLTTRGSNRRKGDDERAILDGRIYNPSILTFDPQENWMHTDLKWENFEENSLFLRHLLIHISANAVKQGVKTIRWLLSYPSVFSPNQRRLYERRWLDLMEETGPLTGITYQCSVDQENTSFRTESLAIAQYFADVEGEDLVYSTCIDMGGGTSDISIWQSNELLHQCSIKFAGRDLLSDFLSQNPSFITKYFESTENWTGLRGGDFHAKFDVLLRWSSEDWLKKKRPKLTEVEDVQGLIRLMALGIGGLYYYVGLLIRTLRANGTYTRDFTTPVYLGGNGSRLLHWLDVTGRFSKGSEIELLLSRLLSRGAGMEDTKQETLLSRRPKDEVACGLVLDDTKLKGFSYRSRGSAPIPAEAYTMNGISYSWDQPMVIDNDINTIGEFKIHNLDNLNNYLYEFHRALRDLQIEGIKPLPGYHLSNSFSDNPQLWEKTERSLTNLLQDGKFTGAANEVQIQPPFILGLKALLQYQGKDWAKSYR